MKLRNVAIALLMVGIVAGCGDSPTPTNVTIVTSLSPTALTSQGTPPPATPQPQVTTPVFNFMPRRGGPGTLINIVGGNFKPGTKVVLRIGIPQPVGEPLGSADVQPDGRWNMSVHIPGTLPSGEPIESQAQGDVQIVAMDDANNVIVSEPFGFIAPGPTADVSAIGADATQPVRDFLTSLKSDPSGKSGSKYLGESLRSQLTAGTSVTALLGIDAVPSDFTIGKVTPGSTPNSAEVAVTLTVNGSPVERSFAVVRALNTWTIEAISG